MNNYTEYVEKKVRDTYLDLFHRRYGVRHPSESEANKEGEKDV